MISVTLLAVIASSLALTLKEMESIIDQVVPMARRLVIMVMVAKHTHAETKKNI